MSRAVVLLAAMGFGCGDSRNATPPLAPSASVPLTAPQSLSGYVADTAFRAVTGARVEVLDGPQAGLSMTLRRRRPFHVHGNLCTVRDVPCQQGRLQQRDHDVDEQRAGRPALGVRSAGTSRRASGHRGRLYADVHRRRLLHQSSRRRAHTNVCGDDCCDSGSTRARRDAFQGRHHRRARRPGQRRLSGRRRRQLRQSGSLERRRSGRGGAAGPEDCTSGSSATRAPTSVDRRADHRRFRWHD